MSMAESIHLSNRHIAFKFKGERDYVHGTDIYTSIANTLVNTSTQPLPASFTQFRLAIRKPGRHACRLDISPVGGADGKPDNAVVEFRFCCGEKMYQGWLSESDSPVAERYSYCEKKAIAGCTVSGETVSLRNCAEYSTIENLVAATKYLHATLFPDACGKWFFSRLDLPQLLPSQTNQPLSISLNQSLGKRLTRSDMQMNGQSIGSIYFSLVPA